MSVILNEIEKRKKQVETYGEKLEKIEALQAEVAVLKKEVEETDVNRINDEIEELTADAIALGYIEKPEDENATEDSDEEDDVSRAESVFATAY